MTHNRIALVVFNAKRSDGCDYAIQTIRELSHWYRVYALSLGEPVTWKDILSGTWRVVERTKEGTFIRPLYVIPGQRVFWIRQLNVLLVSLVLRIFLAIRYSRTRCILWFFEPWNMLPVLRVFSGYVSVYDCVDYYRSVAYEPFSHERRILRDATFVTCISPVLRDTLRKYRHDIVLVPAGFASRLFRNTVSARDRPRTTVGFIGGINYRLDFPLLMRVIRSLPRLRFDFYGPIQYGLVPTERGLHDRIRELFAEPNVRYLGVVEKREIPDVLKRFDVGIIPYDAGSAFNTYSVPMKVFEYFGCGIPVLSTPIPSLQQYREVMVIGSTASSWITSLRRIMADGWPKRIRTKGQRIAQRQSWQAKVRAILDLVDRHVEENAG